MDPNGGTTPSAPRLDNQPPTDIYQQLQPTDQIPMSGGSIPPEMPAAAPAIQEALMPPMPPQTPDWPSQPMEPVNDPMMQPPMEAPSSQMNGGGSNPKRIIVIVVIALVAIGVLGGGAYAIYNAGKSAGRQASLAEFQQQQAQQQTTDDPAEEAPQLDLTETASRNDAKEEVVEGAIKEQVNASDGFSIMVNDIERNYAVEDANYQLDEGKELIKVNIIMGNRELENPKDIDSFNFRLDVDGTELTPESIAEYPGKFGTIKLDPGAQQPGSIIFAVPKESKKMLFVREQRYRVSNQNKELTTRIEITVSE